MIRKIKVLAISICFLIVTTAQENTELTYVCPPCGSICDNSVHSGPGKCEHCSMDLITIEEREKIINRKRKRIAFYLQDGVEVLDFAGPMEVFAYAGFKVFTVSETTEPIESQGILTIIPDYNLKNAPKADILAFFGGNSSRASENPAVINWVKAQKDIELHFSVCTGAFVLAEAGLLDGKEATTFHLALDRLENDYPKIKVHRNARYVDDGEVITTAGISAGIDGALHIVARIQGLESARRIAQQMEYDYKENQGLYLGDKTLNR